MAEQPLAEAKPRPASPQPAAEPEAPKPSEPAAAEEPWMAPWLDLVCCIAGLQTAYITWGIMQETIMTTEYSAGRFPSPTFCVLANRLLAVFVAAVLALRKTGTLSTAAPFHAFSFCSISNVLSSYGQYAALQYASFPLQVLFKSSKVIPVMLMGKILNGRTYGWVDYGEAVGITAGVATFSLFNGNAPTDESSSRLLGFLLLTMYVVCDSFTSQWQSRLYEKYPDKKSITQYHMMFYVNAWSIVLTSSWLILSQKGMEAINFIASSPEVVPSLLASAVAACIGQMFIFYTIRRWGPIVFTVIMTTRQMISMMISCAVFGHTVTIGMLIGAAVVFSAVFHGAHRKWSAKKASAAKQSAAAPIKAVDTEASPAAEEGAQQGRASPERQADEGGPPRR